MLLLLLLLTVPLFLLGDSTVENREEPLIFLNLKIYHWLHFFSFPLLHDFLFRGHEGVPLKCDCLIDIPVEEGLSEGGQASNEERELLWLLLELMLLSEFDANLLASSRDDIDILACSVPREYRAVSKLHLYPAIRVRFELSRLVFDLLYHFEAVTRSTVIITCWLYLLWLCMILLLLLLPTGTH